MCVQEGKMYLYNANVLLFEKVFELACEPKEVSDHYPVYARLRVSVCSD